MAIKNPHGFEIIVKRSEGSNVPVATRKDWPHDQDGFAVPAIRPGEVFKSVNGVNVEILKDGRIVTDAAAGIITLVGQAAIGGWHKKPTEKMGSDWNALFKRSLPNKPKKPKEKQKKPVRRAGGERAPRHNGNRAFMDDLFVHGIEIGGGSVSTGRGYAISRDLD